jgi:hypothetical protein
MKPIYKDIGNTKNTKSHSVSGKKRNYSMSSINFTNESSSFVLWITLLFLLYLLRISLLILMVKYTTKMGKPCLMVHRLLKASGAGR